MEKLLSLEESAPHAWAVEKSAAQCNPATTAMRQQMLGSQLHGVNFKKQ